MKHIAIALLLALTVGCAGRTASVRGEHTVARDSAFFENYEIWQQENEALASRASADGSYAILHGATDSETGKFTPTKIMEFECQLGQEAHLHEAFLLRELAKDPNVHRILEKSPRLCEKYGIDSAAYVLFVPKRGYIYRTRDGLLPQQRQGLWLRALRSGASHD